MSKTIEQTTLTYIHHDGFFLETVNFILVFDFWTDPLSPDAGHPWFLDQAPADKPLYVLVSHHHKDHYSRAIFEWARRAGGVHYILSKDTAKFARHIIQPQSVYKGPRPRPEQVTVLGPGESYSCPLLKVHAFGSTDIGNSYVVEWDGHTAFHAGDLNAWVWIDESTPAEVEKAMADFRVQLQPIAKRFPKVDYAMFPVDARLGTRFWTGAKEFMDTVKCRRFIPMHFTLGETPEQQRMYPLEAANFKAYLPYDKPDHLPEQCIAMMRSGDRLSDIQLEGDRSMV